MSGRFRKKPWKHVMTHKVHSDDVGDTYYISKLRMTQTTISWMLNQTQLVKSSRMLLIAYISISIYLYLSISIYLSIYLSIYIYIYIYISLLGRLIARLSHDYDSKWLAVAFHSAFWISTELVYLHHSAVWLLHGWCHVKLLPSRRVQCTPYNHASCHGTSCKATYVFSCN